MVREVGSILERASEDPRRTTVGVASITACLLRRFWTLTAFLCLVLGLALDNLNAALLGPTA